MFTCGCYKKVAFFEISSDKVRSCWWTELIPHCCVNAMNKFHIINCSSGTKASKKLGTKLIQCNLCSKQYTGKTKRHLKDHLNEHRQPILNPNGSYWQFLNIKFLVVITPTKICFLFHSNFLNLNVIL